MDEITSDGGWEALQRGHLRPFLIHPNPMYGADERYVVINSGHTFREEDSATINYLLFPRLGDWAVMNIGPDASLDATGKIRETPLVCGYFDEQWCG